MRWRLWAVHVAFKCPVFGGFGDSLGQAAEKVRISRAILDGSVLLVVSKWSVKDYFVLVL
jgi:hypothetical protein